MDRGFGTHSGDGAQGTDHEVLVQQVLLGSGLGGIFAKVGDLGGVALALEGGLVGTGRVGTNGSGAEASGNAGRGSRYCARQGASGRCEGCHGYGSGGRAETAIGDGEVEVFSKALTTGNQWSLESKTCA